MDIVIYMNERDFKHKTSLDITAYWFMKRVPVYFKEGEKIYMATKSRIQGSVICEELNSEDLRGGTVVWDSRSWNSLGIEIPCKPFRGFRYRWWLVVNTKETSYQKVRRENITLRKKLDESERKVKLLKKHIGKHNHINPY